MQFVNLFALMLFWKWQVSAITPDHGAPSTLRRLSECGPLYDECDSIFDYDYDSFYDYDGSCCEINGLGIFVWLLVTAVLVVGIVAASCACCKCCPWHDRMCCANRQNAAPAAAPAVKGSHTESSDTPPMKTPESASNVHQ